MESAVSLSVARLFIVVLEASSIQEDEEEYKQ